ncbi:hypothetical protein KZ846_31305, partial [Pseudomonas aeruginosa]
MNGIPPLSSRDAHASPPQRVLERLHSSAAGLDADEAARRLAAHGYSPVSYTHLRAHETS